MFKLLATGVSALMSVGALIDLPQQSIPGGKPGAKVEEVETVELKVATPDLVLFNDDSAEPLRSAYVVLRQLRSERLEERPRELTNRAVVIYRDGLKAFETGDERRARTLGTASLNLARAVELTRQSQRDATPDPDLPAPPPVRVRIVQGDKLIEAEKLALLPDLPPLFDGENQETTVEGQRKSIQLRILPRVHGEVKVEGVKVDAPAHGEVKVEGIQVVPPAQGEVKVEGIKIAPSVRDEVKVEGRKTVKPLTIGGQVKEGVIVLSPEGGKATLSGKVVVRSLGGEEKRAFVVEAPKFQGTIAPKLQGKALTLQKVVVPGQRFQALTLDSAARARIELRRAYEGIKAAREKSKAEAESAVYLDAAKDLYNAARRDAEAGRNEQASELARAAESLARVPGLLKGLKDPEKKVEGKVVEGHAIVEVKPEAAAGKVFEGHAIVEVKPEVKEQRVIVRVAPKQDEGKEEPKAEKAEAVDEEDQVVGIGVALKQEDSKLVVLQVLPGSPAAEGESLKEGDRLIGIKVDDETEAFEGKELAEIVKLIRGKPGSKVRLVVIPNGSEEKKVIELVRRKLDISAESPKEEKKEEGEGKPQSFRFVVPGGGEVHGAATIRLDPAQLGKLHKLEALKGLQGRVKGDRTGKTFEFRLDGTGAPADAKAKSKDELPPPIDD